MVIYNGTIRKTSPTKQIQASFPKPSMPCEDRCFWTQDRALRLGVQTLPLTRFLIGKSPDNGDGKSLVKYLFALVKYTCVVVVVQNTGLSIEQFDEVLEQFDGGSF